VGVIFKQTLMLIICKVFVQMINCRNDKETVSIRPLE